MSNKLTRRNYMRAAIAICLFSFFISFCVFAKDLPLPLATVLKEQKTRQEQDTKVSTYIYDSQLSAQDIEEFYYNQLTSDGWNLQEKISGVSTFNRNGITEVIILQMLSAATAKPSSYMVTVREMTRYPTIPVYTVRSPRSLSFMPSYTNATEFIYNTKQPPMVGLGYLSWDKPAAISSFYLDKMPKYGWRLISNTPNSGTYSLLQWLDIIDPYTRAQPGIIALGYTDLVPPLPVQGVTLRYEKGNESCLITIYNFPNIIAKAKGTKFDLSAMEKYGDTLICVYYFSDKTKEGQPSGFNPYSSY